MANLMGLWPKLFQMTQPKEDKTVQHLIAAFAVEHAEIAMYEALASAASAGGDTETMRLAREIQGEEQKTAERIWNVLSPTAAKAFAYVTAQGR